MYNLYINGIKTSKTGKALVLPVVDGDTQEWKNVVIFRRDLYRLIEHLVAIRDAENDYGKGKK